VGLEHSGGEAKERCFADACAALIGPNGVGREIEAGGIEDGSVTVAKADVFELKQRLRESHRP
jgi:hypothetical protein